jgi:hypothetical protein
MEKKTAVGIGIALVAFGALYLLLRSKGTEAGTEKGSLLGKVTNTVNNSSLPGVTVSINGTTALTNPQGNYAIYDLDPGQYTVEFAKEGFTPLIK